MLFGARKLVATSLALLMTIAPIASQASTFQYLRMYGGGQGGTVVSPPVPTGTLSYSVAGPSTATVGVPYSAISSTILDRDTFVDGLHIEGLFPCLWIDRHLNL